MTDSQALGAFLTDHPEYVHPQPEASVSDHERTYGIPSPTRAKSVYDPAYDRERAAEARHGGRYITEALARHLTPSGTFPFAALAAEQTRAILAGDGERFGYPPEALRNTWYDSLSPYSGTHTDSGRASTAAYARSLAAGGDAWELPIRKRIPLLDAEAMLDWPVYRAATTPTWDAALDRVRNTINGEGHGPDCALRCIPDDTLDCGREHGCDACAEDDRPLPTGCTGYWPDIPSVIEPHHDGETCPVHETAVP
jgi:hypothetical protein